jgi:hypothetical protein
MTDFNVSRLPQLAKLHKRKKVPFNLIKHDSKPYSLVIKGISLTTTPKAIQDELLALGMAVQNVIPMTTGETKCLPMHIIELDSVAQSQFISHCPTCVLSESL